MSPIRLLKKRCPWQVKSSVARFNRQGIILLYHRVNEAKQDPWCMNVSPKNFNDHMQIIKKYGQAVKICDMGRRRGASWAKDEIAITFDDGFSDNFHKAMPILEKHLLPATFFITAYGIVTQGESWTDKLARTLTARCLPPVFEMTIAGIPYRWRIDAQSKEQGRTDDLPARDAKLSGGQLVFCLRKVIMPLDFDIQNETVERILSWAGHLSTPHAIYRPMTAEELKKMAASGLFEIGAHTDHHPLLSACSFPKQQEEIINGRRKLEGWIDQKVSSFAFPFGDYSHDTLDILKQQGFGQACTTAENPVMHQTNRLELPRYMVLNWKPQQFEENLRYWLTRRPEVQWSTDGLSKVFSLDHLPKRTEHLVAGFNLLR